jgi:hypothetical protein
VATCCRELALNVKATLVQEWKMERLRRFPDIFSDPCVCGPIGGLGFRDRMSMDLMESCTPSQIPQYVVRLEIYVHAGEEDEEADAEARIHEPRFVIRLYRSQIPHLEVSVGDAEEEREAKDRQRRWLAPADLQWVHKGAIQVVDQEQGHKDLVGRGGGRGRNRLLRGGFLAAMRALCYRENVVDEGIFGEFWL